MVVSPVGVEEIIQVSRVGRPRMPKYQHLSDVERQPWRVRSQERGGKSSRRWYLGAWRGKSLNQERNLSQSNESEGSGK